MRNNALIKFVNLVITKEHGAPYHKVFSGHTEDPERIEFKIQKLTDLNDPEKIRQIENRIGSNMRDRFNDIVGHYPKNLSMKDVLIQTGQAYMRRAQEDLFSLKKQKEDLRKMIQRHMLKK